MHDQYIQPATSGMRACYDINNCNALQMYYIFYNMLDSSELL